MRRIRVLLFALCAILAASWLNPASVYADEGDELVVTITSDASEYRANDTATFTIEMTNEASTPATDVEYSVTLPAGMRAQDEASLTAEVPEIGPGETVVKTVKAYVYEDTTVGGVQSADGTDNGGGASISQVNAETDLSQADKTIPQTGDSTMVAVAALVIAGLAAVAAGFFTKRRKGGAGVLGIALCLLAAGVAFSNASSAYADEYVSRQTDASCRVSVNGQRDEAAVSVSYTALEQTPNPGVGGEGGGSVIYEFSDDVLVVDDYQYVEGAYLFESGQDVAVGDKIAFDSPSDEETLAVGVVTQTSQIGDDTLVQIDQATNPEDVFEYIAIDYGTPIDWSEVELSDGVTIMDTPSTLASHSGFELPQVTFSVDEKLSGGGQITGKFSMSNWIDAKFDWSIWSGLKEAKLGLESSEDITFEGSVESEVSRTIPINKTPFQIHLSHGACLFVNFNLVISLDGKVELVATFDANVGVQYKNGNLETYDDADAELSLIAEADAKAGASSAIMLTLMSVELFDVQPEVGLAGAAKTTLRDTGLVCTDLDLTFYITVSAGKNTVWMNAIGLTLSRDIFEKELGNYHVEDGKAVEECTYKSSSTGSGSEDPVSPETSDFVYTIEQFEDGSASVYISNYIGDDSSIVIPAQIEGIDVVSVNIRPYAYDAHDGSVTEEICDVRSISFEEESKVSQFLYNDSRGAGAVQASLETLDLSGATELESIYVVGAQIASIDLSVVPQLQVLELSGCPNLASVDVSSNQQLVSLNLSGALVDYNEYGSLSNLVLGELPNLTTLYINNQKLSNIDLSGCTNLEYVNCIHNLFEDLSEFTGHPNYIEYDDSSTGGSSSPGGAGGTGSGSSRGWRIEPQDV